MSQSEEITIEVKHEETSVDAEVDDDDNEGNLMIVDEASANNDGDDPDDDDDGGVNDVVLEKLPRPVNELNCRQSRTWLVKLLRAANGGLNPQVRQFQKDTYLQGIDLTWQNCKVT